MNKPSNLTNDANILLTILYKKYLEDRQFGVDKSTAKFFGSSIDIHKTLMPKWNFEDVDETCRELSRTKYLDVSYADDICFEIVLSDNAIIYNENKFQNNLKTVIKYIKEIAPLALPFL